MSKHNLIWLLLSLILLVALSGCGAIMGEEEHEAAERLSLADWPTPPPTATPLTPTPFPKVAGPTATPTAPVEPEVEPTPAVSNVSATTAEVEAESAFGEAQLALLARANSLVIEQYPTVAVAFTTTDNPILRNGPGAGYGLSSTMERGELLGIVGKNGDGTWLYGFGTGLKRGWIPAEAVRTTGSLEKAPVLPADPIQAVLGQLGLTAEGLAAPAENATSAAPAVELTDLPVVAKAVVKTNGLNVRQGPGPGYGRLTALAQNDEVDILAINKPQDWVLISTDSLALGWTSLANLTVQGSLSAAPTVTSALPDADIPAGGIAPVTRLVAADGAVTTAPSPPTGGSSAATGSSTAPSTGKAAVVANPLGPVTTATLNRVDVALRRGPGETFGLLDTLTSTDIGLDILGRDGSGTWVLVQLQNFSEDLGWIAVSDLTLAGSSEAAPVVLTAEVQSNEISVRQGPGIYEPEVGKLGINTLVRVFGLDQQRSWALVQPVAGPGLGWTQLRLLTVNGPLADIPLAPPVTLLSAPAVADQPLAPPPIAPRAVSDSQLVIQLASGGEIVVINPDGSGLRRLTNGIDPVLSPDGQTVAFTRWQGETGSLWLADLNGGNERSLAGFIKQAKGPEWSPDGSQIVLNFQQGGRLEPQQTCTDLTQDDPRRPPRGATDIETKIDDNGDPELCWELPPDFFWSLKVIDVADGRTQDLDGGTYAFRPAWDPSQPWRIVSDGGRGLLASDINNQSYRETVSENVTDSSPVFSPDGRYLAVTAGPPGGGSGHDIYRLNRDGSGRVRLTETPLWGPVQPDSNGQQWNNVAPTWSPDAAQIAFLTDRAGRWEIWLMNSDGSEQRPMFSAEINDQLAIQYDFVDERVMSWR